MLLTNRVALSLVVFTTLVTTAAAEERFERLARDAERVESLGPFLERYIGSCSDPYTRDACERNVRATRRTVDGRVFSTLLDERTVEIVRAERTRSGWRFVVTPFIDGGGLALTNGEPRGDGQGRPRIGYLILDGSLPDGMDDGALESALRTGRLQLEVVFRPEGSWKLKRRGQSGYYEGVKARFLALRLVEVRSGVEIASRVY
jgi:hypothetical protein